MTISKLNEFAAEISDENKWDHSGSYKLAALPIPEKAQIVREYNKLKNPDLRQTLVVSNIEIDRSERIHDKADSDEILKAYAKCAKNLAASKDTKLDYEKRELGRHIKQFVCGHASYSAPAFGILSKYLTDVDVIEPVRSCMSRDHSLIDKGFAAIHKSADAMCAKAKKEGKEEPQFAASDSLRLAFADLYNFNGQLDSADTIDKITSYFPSFDKQIRRMNPEKHRFLSGNLEMSCNLSHERAKSDLIYWKMHVLHETFHEFEQSSEPFEKIYEKTAAKYKDKVERSQFNETVRKKVWNKIATQNNVSDADKQALNNLKKDYYNEMKIPGNTEINKILMSARRDARKK